MLEELEYEKLLESFRRADRLTKFQLLSLWYFMIYRLDPGILQRIDEWRERNRLQRMSMLFMGAYVFSRARKGVAKPSI